MRILTFDIEEWFNILETKANSNYKSWDKNIG